MSLAIGSHGVTCHLTQVNTPHLNPSQTGWCSTYLHRKMEGWVENTTSGIFREPIRWTCDLT